MCKEGDALFIFRLIRTDNVACFQQGTVIGDKIGILVGNRSTELLQLSGKIVAAGHMPFAVGHTRSEIDLFFYILIGTVGIELRCLYGGYGLFRHFACFILVAARRK